MENNLSIKICGINNEETAKVCNDVDYVDCFLSKVNKICYSISSKEFLNFFKTTKKVSLFVNANHNLMNILKFVNLDFINCIVAKIF